MVRDGFPETAVYDMLRHAARLHLPIPVALHDLLREEFLSGDYYPEYEAEMKGYFDQMPALKSPVVGGPTE
ncbi:hypothetical protein [Rhodococcus spongiicola]|uniref:hypothetical protein n=1 Tax=Rhodococcus spongiicola TaxID=2487352 RepID=UPI0013E29F72|nr:hypothetical protein [Rhodococcus spongiicola]